MIKWYRVSENSLVPLLYPGDYVLVVKSPLALIRAGDLVVLNHPVYGTLIKQVELIDRALDEVFVVGLSSSSIDSRSFGPVSSRCLLGRVIWKVHP